MSDRYVFRARWKRAGARALDACGSGMRFFFERRSSPQAPRRILVVRLDQIGDAVLTLPLFAALKKRFPDAEVTALVDSQVAPLFEGCAGVDHVVAWSSGWYRASHQPVGFFQMAGRLRQSRFEVGLDARGDARAIALLFVARIPFRAGFGSTGGGFLLNRCFWKQRGEHETSKVLRLTHCFLPGGQERPARSPLHGSDTPADPVLTVHDQDFRELESVLGQQGLTLRAPYVVMHPAAHVASKRWPLERFRHVGESLAKKGFAVVVVGGGEDSEAHERAFQGFGFVVLSGKLGLRTLAALAARSCFFVGNDSGPSHIAAAVGARVAVIASGATRYEEWRVSSEKALVFQHEVPCSPCGLTVCPLEGHPCLEKIQAEQVERAIVDALEVTDRAG